MNKHLLLLTLCSMQLLRCGLVPLAGGSTDTELGSVVTGRVYDEQGKPALHTQVGLVPRDHNPVIDAPLPDRLIDTTDSRGAYSFAKVTSGVYNIEQVQLGERTRALINGVVVADDTVMTPDGSLRKPGFIRVMLTDDIATVDGYVYIPGTTIASNLNENALSVTLDSVPAGMAVALRLAKRNSPALPRLIADSVRVDPGDTTIVAGGAWRSLRKVRLNTALSGAGVAGDVCQFPLLVRLTKDKFDFSTARAQGEDIRFAKPDNTPLAFEIERWDPVDGLAEVWVKIDTVHGNDSTQSFLMYWGNDTAAGNSNSAAVFDTANGFQGVWHLNENGDSVYDATADAFHGANSGSVMSAGIIGNSRKFADGNYLKITGLLNSPSSVSLSAWVQSEKSTGSQDVISIGDAVMIRLDDYLFGKGASGWYHNSPITSDDSKYAIDSSGRYLANTGWHYLTFAINSETHIQTLYIDGVQSVAINDTNPIYYAGLGADTYIGIHGNGKTTYNFGGQIDEVRVSAIAESPDRVKLCFMNQKVPDALVKW